MLINLGYCLILEVCLRRCPLDISTRRNPFIFSSKIGENSFAMSSETTCPSQRQLTHHHFLPPYPSITLLSSDFSKPLNPPSSVSTAHTLSPVLGLLQSISSHQSFCLCLCPFQPHYMNCLQVSLSKAPMEVSKQSQ